MVSWEKRQAGSIRTHTNTGQRPVSEQHHGLPPTPHSGTEVTCEATQHAEHTGTLWSQSLEALLIVPTQQGSSTASHTNQDRGHLQREASPNHTRSPSAIPHSLASPPSRPVLLSRGTWTGQSPADTAAGPPANTLHALISYEDKSRHHHRLDVFGASRGKR